MKYHFEILIIWRSLVQAQAGPHKKNRPNGGSFCFKGLDFHRSYAGYFRRGGVSRYWWHHNGADGALGSEDAPPLPPQSVGTGLVICRQDIKRSAVT